jgi:AAA domain
MVHLEYIGQDVARAAPGEQLSVFVERANTAGQLLRKGFFTPEVIEQELWGVAIAYKLTGEPDSECEKYVADVIEAAIAIDDEPRGNGHDGEPPPHTEIPEGADTDSDRKPAKNTTTTLSKKPYKLVHARDVTIKGTVKSFLIDGFLGRDEISIWFGPPECGKSTAKIDAACHVATGRPWCGRAVLRGPVLYVAAERGQTVMRRIMAWRLEHGIDDFPLAVIDDTVDLRTGKVDADRIIAAAKALGTLSGQRVIWIIFDTLSRVLAGGDENSPRDMGLLVLSVDRIYRDTGAHCSLVHHVPLGGDRMRGHSSAPGAADTTVRVEKHNGIVTAAIDKASDLPEDEKPRLFFRFKSITLTEEPRRTASVMVQAEDQAAAHAAAPKTKTRKETKVIRTFRDAFTEALDTDGNTIQVRGDGPEVRAVDVQKVRAEFERRYATGEADPKKRADASRKAFKRSMAELPPQQFATETREGRELIWKVD